MADFSSKRFLVIDTDAGVDDAAALLAAFGSGEFDILALTTIYGNSHLRQTTRNVLSLLEAFHQNKIPVYQGAAKPFSTEQLAVPTWVHGEFGLGSVTLPPPTEHVQETSASQFIVDVCHQYPGQVHLLFLGPLTNLADAIRLDPDLPSKWAKVAVMGGAFNGRGNVTPYAEANFIGDPVSAEHVFRHGKNILVVGLDVTMNCVLTKEDMEEIARTNDNGDLLSRMYDFYLQSYARFHPELDGAPPHDAVAFLALISPELFQWEAGKITVTPHGECRGQSTLLTQNDSEPPVHTAAMNGDYDAIISKIKSFIMHPVTTTHAQ